MPHVSRISLTKEVENQLIDTLDLVLTKLSKKDDVKRFLLSLLTPTERLMLAKRLTIIILLKEGLTESEVAKKLHVTRVTVSRLQLFLEARGEGYEVAMKLLQNEAFMKELKSLLFDIGGYAVRAAGGRVKPTIT